jgi:cell division protein FtsZ
MSEMGKAMMGTGEAEGDKRAIRAAEAAISNPLLDEVSMKGAKGVLINITGSMDMTLFEVDEAANRIRSEVDPDANIIVGSTFNQDLASRVRVSVVATGIDAAARAAAAAEARAAPAPATKPWREIAAAPIGIAADPAPAPVRTPAPAAAASAIASPATERANPVGDVHERIRRLLIEGAPDGAPPLSLRQDASHVPASSPRPAPQLADPDRAPKNPFREAQAIGRSSLDAALDIFNKIGASKPRRELAPRSLEAARPLAPRADLFDDDADADLEIPSFLRKKKTGS